MPAPISPRAAAFSKTRTEQPFRASPSAAASPPMPPPAIRTRFLPSLLAGIFPLSAAASLRFDIELFALILKANAVKLLGLRTGPNPQHDGRSVSGEARAKSDGPAAPQSYLCVGVLAMRVMRSRSSPEVPHRAGRAQLEA